MHTHRRLVLGFFLLVLSLRAAVAGERELHIYTWSDYFDQDVVELFEEENGCRVSFSYFDSNESMYAKLKAGAGGYDIITPSSYMSALMHQQNMLDRLDHSLLPNLSQIDPDVGAITGDSEYDYSVPYTRTIAGVGYDKDRVKAEWLGSWNIFGNAALSRRMTMLNDMRETIGAALKYLGYSLNTTDDGQLDEAADVVIGWKRNLAKFDVDEAKIGLDSGEFYVVHNYEGDIAQLVEENPSLGFYIPREGSSFTFDEFVLAAGAANRDLAHAFINHMLDPENAVRNMLAVKYYMPNPAAVALVEKEHAFSPIFNIPGEILDKCEMIRDIGADNVKYVRAWDKIKAAE